MKIKYFGVWLREMDTLPTGYGFAWWDPRSCRGFCMLVPFNVIARAFRAWWLQIRRPCEDDPIEEAYRYGHNLGWSAGNDHGYETGLRHARIAWEAGQRS